MVHEMAMACLELSDQFGHTINALAEVQFRNSRLLVNLRVSLLTLPRADLDNEAKM